ncbi:unnamed protein product [Cochlearia groenlandica]
MELRKLEAVEKHMSKCTDARRLGDLKLVMCKVEALLKLHRFDDAQPKLLEVPNVEPVPASCSQTRFSGMVCEAYTYLVKSQIEMALGR